MACKETEKGVSFAFHGDTALGCVCGRVRAAFGIHSRDRCSPVWSCVLVWVVGAGACMGGWFCAYVCARMRSERAHVRTRVRARVHTVGG
eukprot:2644073-Pleurochrysis_carterae.AAC.2